VATAALLNVESWRKHSPAETPFFVGRMLFGDDTECRLALSSKTKGYRTSCMKFRAPFLLLSALFACGCQGSEAPAAKSVGKQIELPLWPGAAPDAQLPATTETVSVEKEMVAGKSWHYMENVTKPTLTVFQAKGTNTGAAVLVFPGGGYQGLAIDLEGTEVCAWLTAKGVTCIVLKYRVPNPGPHWESKC
jgi:hypothetical protein